MACFRNAQRGLDPSLVHGLRRLQVVGRRNRERKGAKSLKVIAAMPAMCPMIDLRLSNDDEPGFVHQGESLACVSGGEGWGWGYAGKCVVKSDDANVAISKNSGYGAVCDDSPKLVSIEIVEIKQNTKIPDSRFWGPLFTLANSCLGAGVLSFPYCFRMSGLVVGLILCIGFGSLLAFSCWSIAYCCDKAQQTDPTVMTYHQLVQLIGGRRLAAVVEIVMWLYLFGISLSFIIIIGDLAQPLLQHALADTSLSTSIFCERAFLIPVIATILVLPLSLQQNISALRTSSLLGVSGIVYLVFMVAGAYFMYSAAELPRPAMVEGAIGVFKSMPIIGFGLGCHIQAPIIFSELGGPKETRLQSFSWVVVGAFALCIAIYTTCGVFAYLTFGQHTLQNVLSVHKHGAQPLAGGYPIDNVAFDIARVCVLVTSVCGYPLNHFPARQAMWSFFCRFAGPSARSCSCCPGCCQPEDEHSDEMPLCFSIVETVGFVALTVLCSMFLTQLATVFDLFGAVCGSMEILIVPGLMWWHFGRTYLWMPRQFVALMMGGIGVVILVAGTTVSIESM